MKYLLILLLFVSCGARKVNKSETKQDTKTETTIAVVDTSKTTTDTKENIKIVDNSTSDEVELTPIDNNKPMVIDGKTYLNTKIKHQKKKANKSIVKDKTIAQTAQKAVNIKSNNKIEETKQSTIKKIDKEAVSFWNYLWVIFLILALIALAIYIKNKFSIL
jgi:CHASE3 domain sensor protein